MAQDISSRMPILKFWEMLHPTVLIINNLVLLLGKHRVTSQVKERIQLQVLVDLLLEGHKVKLMVVSLTGILGMISRGVPSHRHSLMKDSTEGTHHLHIPLHHHFQTLHFQTL